VLGDDDDDDDDDDDNDDDDSGAWRRSVFLFTLINEFAFRFVAVRVYFKRKVCERP